METYWVVVPSQVILVASSNEEMLRRHSPPAPSILQARRLGTAQFASVVSAHTVSDGAEVRLV